MTQHKWWVLMAVACGTFMATLDSSIVNIALPTLTKATGSNLDQIKWVVIIYLLVITCMLLPFGRLSDLYGRKRVYQLGYATFIVGSAFCSLSNNLTLLLVSRAIQAFGAAMLMANGPAVITASFPAGELGKALGILAMVVSSGLICGPALGGFLISRLSWPSIFWVNIPIGLCGIILVQFFLAKDPKKPETKIRFDWAGSIAQILLLLSLLSLFDPPYISIGPGEALPVPRILLLAIAGLITLYFVKIEIDTYSPLIDLSLFKIRRFLLASLASIFNFIAYSSIIVLMPFFLEEIQGYSPEQAGLFMAAIPILIFIIAPISGRLSDRFGSRWLSVAGLTTSTITLLLMSGVFNPGLTATTSHFYVTLALCGMGAATGLFQSPNNNAMMSAVPQNRLGIASALGAAIRNLGFAAGTSLATSLFSWNYLNHHSFTRALHFSYFVAGLISCLAVIVAFNNRIPKKRNDTPGVST